MHLCTNHQKTASKYVYKPINPCKHILHNRAKVQTCNLVETGHALSILACPVSDAIPTPYPL